MICADLKSTRSLKQLWRSAMVDSFGCLSDLDLQQSFLKRMRRVLVFCERFLSVTNVEVIQGDSLCVTRATSFGYHIVESKHF